MVQQSKREACAIQKDRLGEDADAKTHDQRETSWAGTECKTEGDWGSRGYGGANEEHAPEFPNGQYF